MWEYFKNVQGQKEHGLTVHKRPTSLKAAEAMRTAANGGDKAAAATYKAWADIIRIAAAAITAPTKRKLAAASLRKDNKAAAVALVAAGADPFVSTLCVPRLSIHPHNTHHHPHLFASSPTSRLQELRHVCDHHGATHITLRASKGICAAFVGASRAEYDDYAVVGDEHGMDDAAAAKAWNCPGGLSWPEAGRLESHNYAALGLSQKTVKGVKRARHEGGGV